MNWHTKTTKYTLQIAATKSLRFQPGIRTNEKFKQNGEDVGHRTFQSWTVMPKLADTHLIWAIYVWIGQVIYESQDKLNFTFRCETPLRKWRFRLGFTHDKNCDYPDGHFYWQGEHPKIYLYVT